MRRILAIIAAALIMIFVALYWTRYQTVAVHDGFYKINRFTGETTRIFNKTEYKVNPAKEHPRPEENEKDRE